MTGLDPAARTAKLSNKEEVRFEQGAAGHAAPTSAPRRRGRELENIYYLRTLGNADAIRDGVEDVEDVVLIGGSYIGCEVAASLTMLGKRCSIVMQEQVTLERGFGAAGRPLLPGSARSSTASRSIPARSSTASRARARRKSVHTKSGLELPAQAVVIGAGVTPTLGLARHAGLEIGDRGGVRM